MKTDCDTKDWARWDAHAAQCERCAPAQKLMKQVERQGESGIGEQRRAELLAVAAMRCRNRPMLAPVLACAAALALSIGTLYLVSELRTPEPVAAPVIAELAPVEIVIHELPEDPFATAFDSRIQDLRERVQNEREALPQRDRTKRVRERVKKLRAALAIDS